MKIIFLILLPDSIESISTLGKYEAASGMSTAMGMAGIKKR